MAGVTNAAAPEAFETARAAAERSVGLALPFFPNNVAAAEAAAAHRGAKVVPVATVIRYTRLCNFELPATSGVQWITTHT